MSKLEITRSDQWFIEETILDPDPKNPMGQKYELVYVGETITDTVKEFMALLRQKKGRALEIWSQDHANQGHGTAFMRCDRNNKLYLSGLAAVVLNRVALGIGERHRRTRK